MTSLNSVLNGNNEKPMIYLVNLRKYNEGIGYYGDWVEVSKDLEEFLAKCKEITGDDDWSIHDYEGFGDFKIREWTELNEVHRLIEFIDHDQYPNDLIVGVMDNFSYTDPQEAIDYLEDNYEGEWDSLVEWADDWLESSGSYGEMDKTLRRYFDLESYARDCEFGGDVFTLDSKKGVYVLRNS